MSKYFKKISIIGCGWLGLPLGKKLVDEGYDVKGSTTSEHKISTLKSAGINPFHLIIDRDVQGDIVNFVKSDLLIINIPPGRRNEAMISKYVEKIQVLVSHVDPENTQILFLSSTSVYENTGRKVDENGALNKDSLSGFALIQAENEIIFSGCKYCIFRLSGLIGPNRHPGKWFAGKSNIPNGDAPVNLVHLDDCIKAIERVIRHELPNEIYNICADTHPSKQEFYTRQSDLLGLVIPNFALGKSEFKVIDNAKFKREYNFEYSRRDLMKIG